MAIPHGTRSCYVKNKCRLPECRAASAAYERERSRKKRRAAGVREMCGPPLNHISEVDLPWLAGLLEGEGSFVRKGNVGIQITVQMTDEDVIRRVHEIVGAGHVYPTKKQKPHHKQAWLWALQVHTRARELLQLLRPFMGQRRGAKFDELIHARRIS